MDTNTISKRLAWRSAYEQRACPSDDILFAAAQSEELQAHLGFCLFCNERLEMTNDERKAWEKIADRLHRQCKPLDRMHEPGQLWSLSQKRAGWGPRERHYNPPLVLILSKIDDENGFRVAQVCSERELMGQGDVWLGDHIGFFAEGWNIYSLHRKDIETCWDDSLVKEKARFQQIKKALAVGLNVQPAEDPLIYSFRELEVSVGAYFSMQSVPQLVLEYEENLAPATNEAFLLNIFGSLTEAYQTFADRYNLPEFADSLIELLTGARDPKCPLPVAAATGAQLPVNIVIKQPDGDIVIRTIGSTLTNDDWQDDIYFVAGRLDEAPQEELYLLASLICDGKIISECQNKIGKDSIYFDIVFRGVPKEESRIKNLNFLLVRT